MSETPRRPDTSWIALPAPIEGAWMCPPKAPLLLTSDQGADFALIPISPAAHRLAAAVAQTKAMLIAETQELVTDADAFAHLQDACGREEGPEGISCIQEGSIWCEEHCPFHE